MKTRIIQTITGLSLFIIALVGSFSFAQIVIMGDVGYTETNTADCSTFGVSGTNFFDNGAAGNYSANFNDTTVFCPDLTQGTKMTITWAINAGFTFNVDGSDWIYVYDGPTTASPLLGQHNSVTNPNGFAYTASWNNPSGCLTVVFISDASVQGTGWAANAACGNPNQPFDPHIEAFVNGVGPNALNPIDTGYVDVCFGDSILFVAKPIFPYSFETTGYGYSQNLGNVSYTWYTSDGSPHPNNDSIWFYPPTRNGFLIDLKITDNFPQIERMLCKVRVSQLPNFTGTGPLEDTVCLGQQTSLIGGVTPTDTVGVDIPAGQFQLGGSFAGLTYLPDGSGQQYQAPITISGFPTSATVATAQDLNQVCITMEHSYLGDLEIALQCPNGTLVPLVNSYSPGFIPGGNSGGGTFLGHPYDDSGGGGAGIGWEYCFSSVFNTIAGSMTANLGNTVAVPFLPANPPTQPTPLSAGNSINPNVVYQPETTFANFAGCPINGQWTIIVQDNLGIDDGWIFEWGLYFDPSFFPGAASYQNYVVTEDWLNDPTIISGQNDTVLVVQPNVPGNYNYTYTVIDDFGCYYDTTVSLYLLPQPEIFADTIACNFGMNVSGTVSYGGGVWSSASPNISFSNPNVNNPQISSTLAGVYSVSFTDDACNTQVTANIDFPPFPTVMPDTALCSLTLPATGTIAYATGGTWSEPTGNISFSPSATTLNPTFTSSGSGVYTITFTDAICGNSASTEIEFISPPSIFVDTIACNFGMNVSGTVAYGGGVWSSASPNISFSNPNVNNPQISSTLAGVYSVSFTDDACNMEVTANIDFPPLPTVMPDTALCSLTLPAAGTTAYATGGTWSEPTGNVSFSPSATTLNPTFTSSGSGVYTITFTDAVCGNSASTEIEFISPPSIFDDTLACNYGMFVLNTIAYNGGIWSSADTTIHFSDSSSLNPAIGVNYPGTYTVTFTDNACNISVSSQIIFPPYAWTDVADTVVCIGAEIQLNANVNWTITNYVWNTGETGPSITVSTPGIYTVTGSNICHSTTDSAIFGFKPCFIDPPNVISLSSNVGNDMWFVQQEGVKTFECSIVNRWGNTIYEFDQVTGGWDGRTQGGNLVEEGTYFYIINAILDNEEPLTKQGFIQVFH